MTKSVVWIHQAKCRPSLALEGKRTELRRRVQATHSCAVKTSYMRQVVLPNTNCG
jgi:hypothetical protein